MSDDHSHQQDLENRQQIVTEAVQRAFSEGLISKDEVWAIGYEAGFVIEVEAK